MPNKNVKNVRNCSVKVFICVRGKRAGRSREREERCLPTWFLFDDTCEDLGIEGAVGRVGVLPLLGLVNGDAAVWGNGNKVKRCSITTPSHHSFCSIQPSLPPYCIIIMTHSWPWGCCSSWWSICVCCMSPLPLVAGPIGYCDIMCSGFRYIG